MENINKQEVKIEEEVLTDAKNDANNVVDYAKNNPDAGKTSKDKTEKEKNKEKKKNKKAEENENKNEVGVGKPIHVDIRADKNEQNKNKNEVGVDKPISVGVGKPISVDIKADKNEKNNGKEKGNPIIWEKGENGREKAEKYERDENGVYYNGEKIEGVDPKTFQVLSKAWAKDINSVYIVQDKLEGADPKTFEVLYGLYAKDKNNIYFFNDKVKGADPKTFQVLSNEYAKDANNVYDSGEKIEGVDPKTFKIPEATATTETKDKPTVKEMFGDNGMFADSVFVDLSGYEHRNGDQTTATYDKQTGNIEIKNKNNDKKHTESINLAQLGISDFNVFAIDGDYSVNIPDNQPPLTDADLEFYKKSNMPLPEGPIYNTKNYKFEGQYVISANKEVNGKIERHCLVVNKMNDDGTLNVHSITDGNYDSAVVSSVDNKTLSGAITELVK